MKVNGNDLEKNRLPAGWRWAKLGEVCQQDRRIVAAKSGVASGLPYLSLEHIEPYTGRILKEELGLTENDGISTTFSFDNRHILYGKLRPYLNKVALPDFSGRCTTEIIPLLPNEKIERDFLCWILRLPSTVEVSMKEKTGSQMPRANMNDLLKLQIPLPPLAQQKRIAAILNEQMAAFELAGTAAQTQLNAAKALPVAYFRVHFKGEKPISVEPVKAGKASGWEWKRLKDVARLESGHTPSRYHPEWWGGETPWIALPDIRKLDGRYAFKTSEMTNEDGIANSSARILPAGTVCLSRTASVGFVTIMGRPMATSQDFVNWVCGPALDSDFLMYALLASRSYIISLASGAVHKTVYMPTAEALCVHMPPLSEQKRIAAELKDQMEAAEKLLANLENQLNEINRLPQALFRTAFSGEI